LFYVLGKTETVLWVLTIVSIYLFTFSDEKLAGYILIISVIIKLYLIYRSGKWRYNLRRKFKDKNKIEYPQHQKNLKKNN